MSNKEDKKDEDEYEPSFDPTILVIGITLLAFCVVLFSTFTTPH